MKKIESLTAEQEKDLQEFRKHWFEIGIANSYTGHDTNLAEKILSEFYFNLGNKKPIFIWVDSPLSAQILIQFLKMKPTISLRDSLWDSLGDSLVYPDLYGSIDSYWISFYIFGSKIGVKYPQEKLEILMKFSDLAKNCGFIYSFENVCIICRKPKLISMKNERLHNEAGPSVEFLDGWKIFNLNGVRVPEWLVMTEAQKIDSSLILKEKNAEIRREIVRKVGTEKLCKDLKAECIEKSVDGMYELLLLDLKDGRRRPYLKMINPSIGVYHIEGVPPECKTIENALNFRNGTKSNPIILT